MHMIPTVADLIKELQELPQDLPVYLAGRDLQGKDSFFSIFCLSRVKEGSSDFIKINPDYSPF